MLIKLIALFQVNAINCSYFNNLINSDASTIWFDSKSENSFRKFFVSHRVALVRTVSLLFTEQLILFVISLKIN